MSDYTITKIQASPYIIHRQTKISEYIDIDRYLVINNISVMITKLSSDSHWWVIPAQAKNAMNMVDIGPFDSWEHCIVFLKLSDSIC